MAFFLKHLRIYFLFFSFFSLDNAQDVQLYAYDQRFSKTKCESGLLRDVDRSVFKADVFDKDATKPYVVFVIKEKFAEKYNELLTFSLKFDCITGHIQDDILVNCKKTNDTYYQIEIQTKALEKYSGASITSYIKNFDDSQAVQLPQIDAPTAARGEIIINDNKVQSTDISCNETIYKDDLDVKFSCISEAQPCVAEIYINDSKVGKSIKNGASYNGKIKHGEEVNITVKYAACRLDGQHNSVSCRINASYIVAEGHGSEENASLFIGIICGVLLLLVLLVIVLFSVCKPIKAKIERTLNKQSSPDPPKDTNEEKTKDENEKLFGTKNETEPYQTLNSTDTTQ